jgi:hypothetical protein
VNGVSTLFHIRYIIPGERERYQQSIFRTFFRPILFQQKGVKLMNQISTEKLLDKLGVEVYPITIVKFLLNKKKILNYFKKATERDFVIRVKYMRDNSDCQVCEEKKSEGILCRQHTSIERVMTANRVLFDLDTNVYFFRNEIFRMVGNRLVIVYCPHPKLITGEITDTKVRKINPITIEDPAVTALPEYRKMRQFISSELLDQSMRCWFNHEFSIVTLPNDRNSQNWCLVPNR